ncbi:HET-domain-containing protein [Nemania abortiva]|nr:HET-domain-containing protein [Nemania abortiva]
MYLLNVQNFQPRLFLDEKARPPYAILSHTWNSDDEEVGFGDLRRYHQAVAQDEPSIVDSISSRLGFKKIERFCNVAKSHGLEWAWVDTCCIDKRSSAGLSEAINSMFKWYRDAERCCVFLQDVTGSYNDPSFRNSRWFSRGWTLQELIAPKLLYFYDQQWELIGMIHDSPLETTHDTPPETTHNDPPETMDGIPLETVDGISTLCEAVSSITSIPIAFLKGAPLADACVAKKMSWASKRQTTRPEDIAYSLLGIFDINMPLLYGEGHRAFIRLQEAIISNTQDHSILAWGTINESKSSWFHISSHIPPSSGLGALAASPADFEDCGDFEAADVDLFKTHSNLDFQVTPGGVKLGVNIYVSDKFAVLNF